MSALTIYHNPRCSKSRQTLQLINDAGKDVTIVEYLKTPLNKAQLAQLQQLLGVELRQMMRVKEAEYKEQGLQNASDEELLQAMVDTPKLMERPIVVNGESTQAIIGRPPENVQTLF
ncbi:arsenate reductase (glutaredoxin) [Thalassotalea ponticola]|uniref:arsenate reductase (glutaredoxin) n=1 Tax=Thalassotalea ponticola TaxID=1523392 RepID=UPI0025B2A4E7|nr:arsenate reductase (glutaredoxin) [Thalassotalea ponticola]MDN3653027.1 arsenate reductase (glutaredoxin) [Thalassotalea ponticola]